MSTAVKAPPVTAGRETKSRVLVAMADTFIGGMGHPGSPLRVAASMEESVRRLPSKADRDKLELILAVFARRSGTFLLTGRPVPFYLWSRDQRTRLMTRWSTSRLTFRRQLFQVFKRLTLLAFLGETEADGSNPVWPEIGYPGPVSAPMPVPKPIRTTTLCGRTHLTCYASTAGSGYAEGRGGGARRTWRGGCSRTPPLSP